ncbi:nuclear transport factor 2 family protein [Pseudonocardia sp. ICBG1293]|uniref:nuclear transport factor 2 family protein n=1 Tax=Pseudonocardia sp. ICBG1293 TaxID=2844382 RepID=UPI001CCF328F|nr:nuclear transport factor 2 family protein [Pseudonocardia sp. ICBG1293]
MPTPTGDRVRLLTASLEAFHRADVDTFMAMYHDDAVHEFPFAPAGMPTRVEGREAIEAWMRTVPDLLTLDGGMHDLRIHEGSDTLTAEWSSTGHFSDGTPAAISYVAVVTFDDDLVTRYRDYINPLDLRPAFPAHA